jgi:hypothetical protein
MLLCKTLSGSMLAMAVLVTSVGCGDTASVQMTGPAEQNQALIDAPELAPTRLLRRLSLSLRGHEPSPEEYAAVQAAADAGALEDHYIGNVEAYLYSDEWRKQMLAFGRDYMGVGDYKKGTIEGQIGSDWRGGQAIRLRACPDNTLHAGKLLHVMPTTHPYNPQTIAICDDPNIRVDADIEPWWAPGTLVTTIGRAGNPVRTYTNPNTVTYDCGQVYQHESEYADAYTDAAQCGCGPNLLYCYLQGERQYPGAPPEDMNAYEFDAYPTLEGAGRRMLADEPAHYFAYIADQDLPMTDLVTGNYTVAPRKLLHYYVRWARSNPDNAWLDDVQWWRDVTDDWTRPVPTSLVHPNLLDQRDYTFDPRVEDGDALGVPSAGVLTMMGPNAWFPRERVRAARWLETFACRDFAAPDPSIEFPAFTGDPYDSGPCMHCHQSIDPAAVHFKRLEVEESNPRHGIGYLNFGGVGGWAIRRQASTYYDNALVPGGRVYFEPYGRWATQFLPNTFLTPVTPERVEANPDARLIDFLPSDKTMFGTTSDGTIGPLGFAKMLVETGEFDKCAVRKIFRRVTGRELDVASEGQLHRTLTNHFVDNNRRVRDLVREIVKRDEFRRGI